MAKVNNQTEIYFKCNLWSQVCYFRRRYTYFTFMIDTIIICDGFVGTTEQQVNYTCEQNVHDIQVSFDVKRRQAKYNDDSVD